MISGETAFKNMTIPYAWPQHPMMNRVEMISPSLPMTFIYGSRSNIDGQSGKAIQEMRPNSHTEIIVSLISVNTLCSPVKLPTVTFFFLIPSRSFRVRVTTYSQTNRMTSTRLCSRYAIMSSTMGRMNERERKINKNCKVERLCEPKSCT